MALYKYVKQTPEQSQPIINLQNVNFAKLKPDWLTKKRSSWLLSVFGLVLVGNALIPIISYQVRYARQFGDKKISPLVYKSKEEVLGAISAESKGDTDHTLISSWFANIPNVVDSHQSQIASYTISIPKLGIEQAKVKVDSEDLKKSLIHYPETAAPGRLGSGVIFGHSVLPQFFDPSNYLSIFSTLHRLKQGDEIIVNYDGIIYRYLVQDLFEVAADDLSVLEQRYDRRFLSLITCSPPGTYLRRLVVKTELIE